MSILPLEHLAPRLERSLALPLPGWPAQSRLAPHPLGEDPPLREPAAGRPAAGLLLVYPRGDAVRFVLTVRSDSLPKHPGQVGLPGGRVEAGESLRDAALREAHEEIGLEPEGVRVLGELTSVYIPVSDSRLHPFVAWLPRTPAFIAHPGEVDRILEVPLEAFLDPRSLREEPRTLLGRPYVVPYYALEGEKVWGATGMALAEFAAVLARA